MSPENVLQQANIHVLRQLADGQALINRSLERLGTKMETVEQAIKFMEGQNLARAVEKLESEIVECTRQNAQHVEDLRKENEHTLRRLTEGFGNYRAAEEAKKIVFEKASESDRKNLWIAIENIKGKIVPITVLGGMAAAVLVTFIMNKVLGNG